MSVLLKIEFYKGESNCEEIAIATEGLGGATDLIVYKIVVSCKSFTYFCPVDSFLEVTKISYLLNACYVT